MAYKKHAKKHKKRNCTQLNKKTRGVEQEEHTGNGGIQGVQWKQSIETVKHPATSQQSTFLNYNL